EGGEESGGIAATLEVSLDGTTHRLAWPPGARMLDVLIDEGLDAPFSCRQGVCGACACQLTAGKVEMAHNEVLEPGDVADGYILACQAMALTPDVSITYCRRARPPQLPALVIMGIWPLGRPNPHDHEGYERLVCPVTG